MLRLDRVRVVRGSKRIVNDVTLDHSNGALALLGPNGAGKSTLLSACAGLRTPDSGSVSLGDTAGHRKDQRKLREGVGFLPQDVPRIIGLSALDQVAHVAWLRGRSPRKAVAEATELLTSLDLISKLETPSRGLSGGEARRMGIAMALAAAPQMLLLDEPMAGLDLEQRSEVVDDLIALSRRVPMIVSTHQTDGLTELYSAVAVMRSGSLIFHGSIDEFLAHGNGADPALAAYRSLLAT